MRDLAIMIGQRGDGFLLIVQIAVLLAVHKDIVKNLAFQNCVPDLLAKLLVVTL